VFKFSIITASYQRLNLLKEQYKNILSQKKNSFDIEWVIVIEKNDFLTFLFLKKIKQIKVTIVFNKKPKEFQWLFSQGIRKAKGDYVLVLGDDDVIKKNGLYLIYLKLKQNNFPNWLVAESNYHDRNYKNIRVVITFFKKFLLKINNFEVLQIINYLMTPAVIVKLSFLKTVKYFKNEYNNINDYETWLQLFKKSKPLVYSKTLFSAGYNELTISGSFNLKKYFFHFILIKTYPKFFVRLISYISLLTVFLINITNKLSDIFKNLFIKKKVKTNSENLKVLHIVRNFDCSILGGIEQVIYQIASKSKIKHTIISNSSNFRKNFIKIGDLDVILFEPTFKISRDIFSLGILKYLFNNSNNYHVIHIHYPHVIALFYILLIPYKKVIFLTYHADIVYNNIITFFINLFFRLTLNKINLIHFNSKTQLENSQIKNIKKNILIEKFPYSFTSINENNISKKILTIGSKKNNQFLLFIARDRHYKGFNYLENIIDKCNNLKFVVISNYKFKKKFSNMILINQVNNDEKFFLIKNCKAIISTSVNKAEGFGMIFVEGFMYSKPSISFKIQTGLSELIKNYKNGFLIEQFNINEYIKKINLLYKDKFLYEKLCKKSLIFYNNNFRKKNLLLDSEYLKYKNV
jgi:glycosyltransferase involved in cell wall biosynthesis